jgi:hypothetical protein
MGSPLTPNSKRYFVASAVNFCSAGTDVVGQVHCRRSAGRNSKCRNALWDNNFFSSLDACALVGILHLKGPKRYLEIGSGNSTKFARFAIDRANVETDVIAIDPHPRAEIDGMRDKLIRKPFEGPMEVGSIVQDLHVSLGRCFPLNARKQPASRSLTYPFRARTNRQSRLALFLPSCRLRNQR